MLQLMQLCSGKKFNKKRIYQLKQNEFQTPGKINIFFLNIK